MANTKSYFQELVEMIEDEEVEEEESAVTLGDLMREAIKEEKVTRDDVVKETTEISSEAQLVADLTWNARGCSGDKPEVNLKSVLGMIRNLAKFGLSEVTITLPDGLYGVTECRYAETLVGELRKKGFRAFCYDNENGTDVDVNVYWCHLLKG